MQPGLNMHHTYIYIYIYQLLEQKGRAEESHSEEKPADLDYTHLSFYPTFTGVEYAPLPLPLSPF